MDKKKLFHGIIAAIIFIALGLGANQSEGLAAVVIVVALILHSGQTVYLFGQNWHGEKKTGKTGTGGGGIIPPEIEHTGRTDKPDLTKNDDTR